MYDKEYKSLTLRLGFTLLFMLLLLLVFMTPLGFGQLLFVAWLTPTAANVLYWGLYCFFYYVAFMLPVPFFMLISGKRKTQKMHLQMRFTRSFPWMALASLGVITATGQINSLLVSPFSGNAGGDDILMELITPDQSYMVVLVFVMLVIVPPFCEEILFRGLVLGNLLPYGKGVAVIGSALLFAAMHQSFSQFLYTAVAGVLMGLLYVESKSIWPSTLVHMLNNMLSFVQMMVYARVADEMMAGRVVLCINLAVIAVGCVSIAVLACKACKEKQSASVGQGLFGQYSLPEHQLPLSQGVLMRRFFSPTILLYLIISLVVALITLF